MNTEREGDARATVVQEDLAAEPRHAEGALTVEPSSQARRVSGLRRAGRLFWNREERRLRALWRLLGHTLVMLAGLVTLGVLIGVSALVAKRLAPEPLSRLVEERLVLGTLVQSVVATAATWFARRALDRRSFASLGLDRKGPVLRDLCFGFFLAGAMLATSFVTLLAWGFLRIEGLAWETSSPGAMLGGLVGMGAVFVCVGWHEELVSRGYWFFNLRDGIGPWTAAFVSSSVFALAHVGNPGATLTSTAALIGAGLLLAWCVVRTGQLWMAIGMHIGWNFFEGPVFGFPVSGMETFALIEHEVTGPPLITGGGFGPEAGLLLLAIEALGAVLIFGVTRGRKAQQLVDPAR